MPSSPLACLTVGLERATCLAAGLWSETELGPGFHHLSRWLPCSKRPSHMSRSNPSGSSPCQPEWITVLSFFERQAFIPWSPQRVLSLGAHQSTHLQEILRTPLTHISMAEYFIYTEGILSLCPKPVLLTFFPRTLPHEVARHQKKKKKNASAFLPCTNGESFIVFNLTEAFHYWNGEALFFGRSMQATSLPPPISGRGNRNRQKFFFFITKSLDEDNLLHIFHARRER